MTNITWNDADLYAYLDGEMNAQRSEALESDLANNVTLQQRLAELRLTLAFVQGVPLREAPRNYILTPSMVEEPAPEPEPETRRRPLLLVMRLATTLSALAFVVMVGLQVNMSLTPQPAAEPQAEVLMLEREQPAESAAAVEEEAPVAVMQAPQEDAKEAATPTAPAEMAAVEEVEQASSEEPGGAAPTWDDGNGGASQGMGGGAPIGEGLAEDAPPDEEIGICGVNDTSEECASDVEEAAEVAGEETTGSEIEPVPTVVTEAVEETAPAETVRAQARPTWQLWLAIAFGVSTVVLGMVTWWLARRG